MPTAYTPIYRIEKGGIDITDNFNDRTTEIQIELNSGGGAGDKCKIIIDDRDYRLARPQVEDKLDVYLGYEEIGLSFMGQFEIDTVTFAWYPDQIILTGESNGLSNAMKAPAVKEYDGKKLGDILNDLAGRAGISAKIHPDLADKMVPFKNTFASPYHTIHELERLYGAVAKIGNGQLIFTPRDAGESASGQRIPTVVLTRSHFGQGSIRVSNRSDYSKIRASYFDGDSNTRKFVEQDRPGQDTTKDGPEFTIGRMFPSKNEAEAQAKATAEALTRAIGEGDLILAKGDPWIRDQTNILINGMRDGVNGSYTAETVIHTYTKASGIGTLLKVRPPGTGVDFQTLFNQGDENFLLPLPGEVTGGLRLLPDGRVLGGV